MMPQKRLPPPQKFAENAPAWTEKLRQSTAQQFTWYEVDGQRADEIAKPVLSQMTEGHCSYCDVYHIDEAGPSVDHFRPKSAFKALAYDWSNLFVACVVCQKRGNRFDEQLLKPDQDEYSFEKYFIYDVDTGKIAPNPAASVPDQKRAETTIDLFGLNRHGKPGRRFEEWRDRIRGRSTARKYRFIPTPENVPT
jgi:uncharacterized protein (TIGR02646 family)